MPVRRTYLYGLIALSFCSLITTAHAAPTKLGAFVRGTGADDQAAKAFEQGMQLAIEKRSPPKVNVETRDASEGKAPESAALKTLIENDRVPLIVYWSVDDIAAAAPYLNQSGVVGLISSRVTKQVARLGANIFGFGYSTEGTFAGLAKYAGNTLKSYRFAMISQAASPFATQSAAFSEETKSLGNTVVFDEKIDPAAANYSALVTRAVKESCDTIFAALPAQATIALIKAARAASYKGKIIIGDSLYAADVASLGKDAEGIYMVQSWSDDAAFRSAYSARFGSAPDNVTLGDAALGYDAITCIQDTGSPLAARMIQSSFHSKLCEGLTGKTQFDGERIAKRTKPVLTVKDGQIAVAVAG